MAKLIAICGPDRVGKATQTHLLVDFLNQSGFKACCIEVPVRGNITYPVIYWMLRNGLAKKLPKVFQWLQYFNRQIFQWTKLSRLRRQYDFIVFDRWSLSTIVYGAAEGVSEEFTIPLMKRLVKPDLTLVLLGPAHDHSPEDVYEKDFQLQQTVRVLYKEWCLNNDDAIEIDASKDRAGVHTDIIAQLKFASLL